MEIQLFDICIFPPRKLHKRETVLWGFNLLIPDNIFTGPWLSELHGGLFLYSRLQVPLLARCDLASQVLWLYRYDNTSKLRAGIWSVFFLVLCPALNTGPTYNFYPLNKLKWIAIIHAFKTFHKGTWVQELWEEKQAECSGKNAEMNKAVLKSNNSHRHRNKIPIVS